MRKLLFAVLLSFLFSAGCVTSEVPINFTPVSTAASATPDPILYKTPEITSTTTPLAPIVSTSQQEIMSPHLTSICPEQQVVSMETLELAKELRLLLLPSSVESYPQIPGNPLSISSKNPLPMIIFDDELYDYSVSVDHKWIYFSRPSDDGHYSILWISSLDGKEQWPVIALDSEAYTGYASWISEQEIFIIGSPHKEITSLDPWDSMPFMSVNPFTLERRQLTYLAREPSEGLYYYGAVVVDNNSFGLYGRLNRVDFIYEYENNKAVPAFQWLDTVDPFDIQFAPILVYDEGKFAVTIARPNGIDLAFNLTIQSASEDMRYDDVMKRIVFPEQFLPPFVLGIVPGKEQVALQRFDVFNSSQGKNWFYVLDYNNQTVYDYCLDLQDAVKRVKFSPDGKFVAFSLEDSAASLEQDQHYVVILNLEKGTIAYLKGYTLVDWGVAGQ